MIAQYGDKPVVVGDRARLEQPATLVGGCSADGVPVLGDQHDRAVLIVARSDDDQFVTVEMPMTLEMVGVVPFEIIRGGSDKHGEELTGDGL